MAPELFQDGGIHSYASDFWALGCVLYECYTARPPFEDKEFTELVKSILTDPVPPLSGNPSCFFSDLIDCLLQKDPAERIKWPELCRHKFWRRKFTPIPLPPQPAFDEMLQISTGLYLSERNGDRPVQQKTPSKHTEKDSNVQKKDVNSSLQTKGSVTPIKNAHSRRALHSKTSGRVDDKQRGVPNATGVNLLRMSRMAKLNLQRDNEKENYRRPLAINSENDAEVKMENNDMELDFGEVQEDDASDEVEAAATTNAEPPIPNGIIDRNEISEQNAKLADTNVEGNSGVFDGDKMLEQSMCPENHEESATPLSGCAASKAQQSKPASECAADFCAASSSDDLSQVFWHSTDLSVRPIMPNRKADKASESMPVLPFEALPACDYAKLSSEKLDSHNSQLIQCLNGNAQVSEKQNVIKYIEILGGNTDAANIITNGPVMLLLVKMLRLPKASALRVQLASAIGSLIRHSTLIQTDLAASGIIAALTNGLRDKHDKVRRFSMAALGELLFYISTLNDHNKDLSALESPSKDNRSISGWQVRLLVPLPLSNEGLHFRKSDADSAIHGLSKENSIANVCHY